MRQKKQTLVPATMSSDEESLDGLLKTRKMPCNHCYRPHSAQKRPLVLDPVFDFGYGDANANGG